MSYKLVRKTPYFTVLSNPSFPTKIWLPCQAKATYCCDQCDEEIRRGAQAHKATGKGIVKHICKTCMEKLRA